MTINLSADDGVYQGRPGISSSVFKKLKPGDRILIGSSFFKPSKNPFLTGEGGGVGVTQVGVDAGTGTLNQIGVFGSKQNFALEFSRETAAINNIRITAVQPQRSLYNIPGDTVIVGPIVVHRRG